MPLFSRIGPLEVDAVKIGFFKKKLSKNTYFS
jgi:hypothetical protein